MSKVLDNPKEQILIVAKELAHEEGLTSLSMRKVASKCNIALGTIYNYYPTKMDIVLAIVEDFWRECFRNFHKIFDKNLDFFAQTEQLYFYVLDYLERFESNWLEDLTNLSAANKSKGKKKEAEFMEDIYVMYKRLLIEHKSQFNPEVFEKFNEDQIMKFILDNFFVMLKRFEHDYSLLDYMLKKILT